MVNENIYKKLKIKSLPPELILKGFIKNYEKCNYEIYMTDLLNLSDYFLEKTNGKKFELQADQSNSQCDAYAGEYGLDFKLLGSQSYLEAKRELSESMFYSDDVCIYLEPKGKKTQIYSCWLKVARGKTIEEVKRIRNNKLELRDVGEKDLFAILKVLEKNKNIVCLFTEYFLSQGLEEYDFDDIVDTIIWSVNADIRVLLQYRNMMTKKDTYLCFIFSGRLFILKWDSKKLQLIDIICLNESTEFRAAYRFTWPDMLLSMGVLQ